MKKAQLIINTLAIAGLVLLIGYHLLKREKIVYVDSNRIMKEYKGMIDARTEFERKSLQWQSEIDTLIIDWQKEVKVYERERNTMTLRERELKEELLYNKQQQLNQYQEAIKVKAQNEEKRLNDKVLKHVNDFINNYGKKKHYTYILGANGSGNIVYANPHNDITDKILEGLKKE